MKSEVQQILSQHGKTMAELAGAMGVHHSRLSRIMNGKLRLTPEMAARLDKAIGKGVSYWLGLQLERDNHEARITDLTGARQLIYDRTDI